MACPKPRPSAWRHSCGGSNKGERVPHAWNDDEPSHWCCPHGCVSFQSPESSALWGHEWALVAWLAENEKRQGVLYEYLVGVRTQADLVPPPAALDEIIDTLPEDAMQLLAVNL